MTGTGERVALLQHYYSAAQIIQTRLKEKILLLSSKVPKGQVPSYLEKLISSHIIPTDPPALRVLLHFPQSLKVGWVAEEVHGRVS